ncbi:MAG TPA: DUF6328 family protein [Longimicrobiales bacterium]|nr:DUF6328 family protein [Longimicrobiales bacterium]
MPAAGPADAAGARRLGPRRSDPDRAAVRRRRVPARRRAPSGSAPADPPAGPFLVERRLPQRSADGAPRHPGPLRLPAHRGLQQGFAQKLSPGEQLLHLTATALVALAVALVMTPAALHRQLEPEEVSAGFIVISSRLLLWSMAPLAIGIGTDLFLVARLVLGSLVPAASLAAAPFAIYLLLWFGLPRSDALRRLAGGASVRGGG